MCCPYVKLSILLILFTYENVFIKSDKKFFFAHYHSFQRANLGAIKIPVVWYGMSTRSINS